MDRKAKARAQTGIYLLAVAAILVIANLLSIKNFARFDVTGNEQFTLSKGSARLIESLKQPLHVDVYVTRGLPKYDTFINDLVELLEKYEAAGQVETCEEDPCTPKSCHEAAPDGCSPEDCKDDRCLIMEFSIQEPKTKAEKETAKEAGLEPHTLEVSTGESGEGSLSVPESYMGMVFSYGSEKAVIPRISPEMAQGLEFWISNKIREMRDSADNTFTKFGIVTGKDEIKISEPNLAASYKATMRGILEQALPFYKFEDVDLQDGEAEINQQLDGIIITQPGKPFTEKELRRIDQFLMRGDRGVVIYASAMNIRANDTSLKSELNTQGLEKLLEGYGIEMKKEAVEDRGQAMQICPTRMMGWPPKCPVEPLPLPAFFIAVAHNDQFDEEEELIDQSFPPFFRMDELAFPLASPLVPHPEKQPNDEEGLPIMKVVARTSPNSYVEAKDVVELKQDNISCKQDADCARLSGGTPAGQVAVAVRIEGPIKSAYGGDKGLGIDAPAQSPGGSRLLIVASSHFLSNPFARAGNPPQLPPQMQMMGPMGGDPKLMQLSDRYAETYLTPAILSFKNTLDWMAGDADLVAVSAKFQGSNRLKYGDLSKSNEEQQLTCDTERGLCARGEESAETKERRQAERKSIQNWVQWTLVLLGPLLFAAFGLFRWWRRESARDHVGID